MELLLASVIFVFIVTFFLLVLNRSLSSQCVMNEYVPSPEVNPIAVRDILNS